MRTRPILGLSIAFAAWFPVGCQSSSGSGASPTSADASGSNTLMAPAAAATLSESCVATINSFRSRLPLGPLSAWTDSAACFSRQAMLDHQSNKGHGNFGMCRESAQNTCPNWSADSSVASVEAAMKRCIESMWNEGPGSDYSKHGHYINMTNTSYTKVGCGFHVQDGSVWINMDFR